MADYPDSDEEFELMYGDELELLREQEEEFIQEPVAKSRRRIDFTTQSKQVTTSTILPRKSVDSSLNVFPSTSRLVESQFELLQPTQAEEQVTRQISPVKLSDTSQCKKRSIQELFGEIDDILNEEIVNGQVKKRKSNKQHGDDYVLIEHILELRKLAKERQNPVALLNKDCVASNSIHNKNNVSYRVPRYSFVVVTRDDKERVYVRFHSEEYEKEEVKKIAKKDCFVGAMGERFKEIWKEAEQYLNKNLDGENSKNYSQDEQTNMADISILKEPETNNTQLWVELYKPKKYLELLSDESTNRTLLRWLKLWDKVVFNRRVKPTTAKAEVKESKFQKQELSMNLDEHGRPEQKVVLLCGPPGLGKTTLAHMVARHAGYNVVEVNASDDRSTEKFKMILENATQMRSILDKENRPNCIVFDEIDGAPSSSIEFLIKFVNGTINMKKKKGTKQSTKILKRPIICICNDVYVPALRPLRQIAFVVNFPPTASSRLAERLFEIARHQGIKTDIGALLALCEKSGCDIRSCLSVLHFFKSLNKPITLSQIYKTNVGQKDIQKGLFAVWQEVFQIQRSKHRIMATSDEHSNTKQNAQFNNLKSRMQKILHIINSFGDYERVAQGIFENYPNMNVKDTSLNSTCEALEWFCFTDVISNDIYTLQNYSLSSYLPYAFVIWHFVFASSTYQKIIYPSTVYEAKVKASKTAAVLEEVMKGMKPLVRAFTYSSSLRLDVLPILSQIITPIFRPVNLHLYTPLEKEQLNHVVSVMIDYNLNYVQERTPKGNYVYNLDPNIDEITDFPGTKPKRILSYTSKQLISREIEVEKMRHSETHKTGVSANIGASKSEINKKKEVSPAQLPNHLQRLKPKAVKSKGEGLVTRDFFGRIVTKTTNTGSSEDAVEIWHHIFETLCIQGDHFYNAHYWDILNAKASFEIKNDVWFQYKEGYNNAVRKRIKVSTLM